MKKPVLKISLLAGVSALAGLTMGGGMARAATHPAIQLFTYEEVAQQYGMKAMPVMVENSHKQGMPYSPKQTCTGGGNMSCHSDGNTVGLKSYSDLANHAFHSALGYNEWMDNSDSGLFMENGKQTGLNPQKPWLQSHAHNGKW
jgi:hypothetical protein